MVADLLPQTKLQLGRLAKTLRDLHKVSGRQAEQHSLVLFVGGKASTLEGRPFVEELLEKVLLAEWGEHNYSRSDLENMLPSMRMDRFDGKWRAHETASVLKMRILTSLYQNLKATAGHQALGLLLKERYFPLVLTTV